MIFLRSSDYSLMFSSYDDLNKSRDIDKESSYDSVDASSSDAIIIFTVWNDMLLSRSLEKTVQLIAWMIWHICAVVLVFYITPVQDTDVENVVGKGSVCGRLCWMNGHDCWKKTYTSNQFCFRRFNPKGEKWMAVRHTDWFFSQNFTF